MTAQIALSQGRFATIDDADRPIVEGYRWAFLKRADGRGGYAVTSGPMREDGKRPLLSMHRMILGAQRGQQVDHVNGDGTDNRRSNIRLCTASQNAANRANRGRLRGVVLRGGQYYATIYCSPARYDMGPMASEMEAALAYDAASRLLHGEFGRPNYPDIFPPPLVAVRHSAYNGQPPHEAIAPYCVPTSRLRRWEIYRARRAEYLAALKRKADLLAQLTRRNAKALAAFSVRDADIIGSLALTVPSRELAERHGISRQRVHQIYQRGRAAGVVSYEDVA